MGNGFLCARIVGKKSVKVIPFTFMEERGKQKRKLEILDFRFWIEKA
jgi:hypothetical protein